MYSLLFLLISSFILTLLLTPLARKLLIHLNVVDVPDDFRRMHRGAIPRAGGVAVVVSFVLSYLLLLVLPFGGKSVVIAGMGLIRPMLAAVLVVFTTGLLDDIFGLRPWQKLLGQLFAAILAYAAGVRVTGIDDHATSDAIGFPVTIIWLLACTNAINLLDGIDGLACGIGLFASLTTILAAALQHNVPLAMAAMPLAGCLSAFLIYNFNPATIFLGDSGSLFIGFLLGCYGIIWSQKSATLLGMTAPLMLLAIPMLDIALSILRRFVRHAPIMQADHGHIHHKLLERGFSIRGAVLLLYAFFGLAAMFSLIQSAAGRRYGGVVIVAFCVCFSLAIWTGLHRLGYVEIRMASRMLFAGTFSRRMLHTQLTVWELQRNLDSSPSLDACWLAISRAARGLGFSSVEMRANGVLFRPDSDAGDGDNWELSIPLSHSDYIHLGRPFHNHAHEFALTIFVGVLRDTMRAKLAQFAMADGDRSRRKPPLSRREPTAAV